MVSRREILQRTAAGFGYLAFASLSTWANEQTNPLAPRPPHFSPRAHRVVFLCMDGGPSHVDTFDYKPRLNRDDGQTFQGSSARVAKLMGSPWSFRRHGQSGLAISELFPEVAKHADQLCVINSMYTDVPAHPQAFAQMHTGLFQFKRPSLGAWTLYGLGTENANLPGFITINPPSTNGGAANYGSAFLPPVFQGTPIRLTGGPVPQAMVSNITNGSQSRTAQRAQLDFIQSLNRSTLERAQDHPGVDGVINSFELAFRMQADLPRLMDLAQESAATKRLYGIDETTTGNFGRQCLLARRFLEAGVRFVEVCHPGWDQHQRLRQDLARNCRATDPPIAGLLTDLDSRGLLEDTLVIWGGEFGRTPYAQSDGRDHNHKGYTMWFAGAGVKAGLAYGQTDDIGYEAIDRRLHIHDWHATILYLLGLDHERLTYRYAGREMRLTDVRGTVAHGLLS